MELPIRKNRPTVFMPWLFDDKDAWIKTIKDEKVFYEMPIDEFLEIYNHYRNKNN